MTIRLVRFTITLLPALCTLAFKSHYMIIQHLWDRVSPMTSLVFPENRGTVPELGDRLRGFSCTGISFSGKEFRLWLFVEAKLFSTGLPLVRICERCFFKSASVPEIIPSASLSSCNNLLLNLYSAMLSCCDSAVVYM